MSSSDGSAAARAERIAQLHARAAFLDTIAPQCNTPVLQERLQDARDALQKAIANPDYSPLVKQGAGTLIFTGANSFGGDTTVISSGTIEIGRPRSRT